MPDEERTPERELVSLRPSKVSLVDEGANAQFWFVAKSVKKETTEEEPNTFKVAVLGFMQAVMNRVESTREWLMQAETDDDADIPGPIVTMLSRTRDDLSDMSSAIESGGSQLEDAKVSGAKRDKMVSMLDVIGEKLASATEKLSVDDEEVSSEFMDGISEVIDGFNAVVGKQESEENVEDTTEESEEGKEMSLKFAKVAKSAAKDSVELDKTEVQKQVGAASAKLEEVMSALAIGADDAKSMDSWDLRWKIGDAVDILVQAAKLDDILGGASASEQESEKEDEEEMTADEKSAAEEKAVDEDEEDAAEEKAADEDEEDAAEEKAVDEDEDAEAEEKAVDEEEEEEEVAKGINLDTLISAISKAVAPISKRLDKIEKTNTATTEKVEKVLRTRPAAKGLNTEDTVVPSNGEGEKSEGMFASVMPPHLRGEVARIKD